MDIIRINMLEYYIAFAGYQTALSNRYASQAISHGVLLGAKTDGAYSAFMCVVEEADSARISYGFTVPEYRNQGAFTELVKYVAGSSGKPVRISVPPKNEFYEYIHKAIISLGFEPTEQVTVFSCSSEDKDKWDQFMETKGRRLCDMLEMRGYRVVSFRDMDESLLEELRNSDRSEYANIFHPAAWLDDPSYKLSWDLSCAAERNGKLSGYCLVTEGDKSSAIFDQISVSASEMGQGVILLPYVYSMKQFFEHGLSSAYYAMYGSNRHANAFRKSVLKVFPASTSTLNNFCFMNRPATSDCNIPQFR